MKALDKLNGLINLSIIKSEKTRQEVYSDMTPLLMRYACQKVKLETN